VGDTDGDCVGFRKYLSYHDEAFWADELTNAGDGEEDGKGDGNCIVDCSAEGYADGDCVGFRKYLSYHVELFRDDKLTDVGDGYFIVDFICG
jgi:hypothetical protein